MTNKYFNLNEEQQEIYTALQKIIVQLDTSLNNIDNAEDFDKTKDLLIDTIFNRFESIFVEIKDAERYRNTFLSVLRFKQDELLQSPSYSGVFHELMQLDGKATRNEHYFDILLKYCFLNSKSRVEISQYIVQAQSLLLVYDKIRSYKLQSGGIVINRKPVKNEAHFNEIQSRLLKGLDEAKVSIRVAIAWFTNEILRDKLLEKVKQGIDVYVVIYDDGINKKHGVDLSNIPHRPIRGSRGGIMHNKFCVIDNQIVITGSYNWSTNAETKNDENLTILIDPEQASKYSVKFRELLSQSLK